MIRKDVAFLVFCVSNDGVDIEQFFCLGLVYSWVLNISALSHHASHPEHVYYSGVPQLGVPVQTRH